MGASRRGSRPPAPRPRRSPAAAQTSWDPLATWYDGWVGEQGSRYHREVVIPAVVELLEPQRGEEILDIGAGQGVLAAHVVRAGASYTGVDASPRLIATARRRHGGDGRFLVGDARKLSAVPELEPAAFDAAIFVLSIQDMDPLDEVLDSASWALRDRARIVALMVHPAFRAPRHSGWGFDEGRKLQFRRVDSYLTPMAVPMKSLGGGQGSFTSRSFHRPIGAYVNGLAARGFLVDRMLEIPDLPAGSAPARSNRASERARSEIPLFLGLRGRRAARGGSQSDADGSNPPGSPDIAPDRRSRR